MKGNEKEFLTEFSEALDVPGMAADAIKEGMVGLVRKRIGYFVWEKIFVRAGQSVAEYEHDNTEESDIRAIAFCRENMKALAKEMWSADDFHFQEILDRNICSMLEESCMEENNRKRCRNHFLQIVMGDIYKNYPDRIERSLLMENWAYTSEILDNQQMQFQETRQIVEILQDIRDGMQENGQEYQRSSKRQDLFSGREEEAGGDEWYLASMMGDRFAQEPEAQRKTAMEAISLWKQEREAYPGWYLAPYKIYRKLWGRTKGYEYLMRSGLLSPEEELALCYEFVWRYETGKMIYDSWMQKNVHRIWKQYQEYVDGAEENQICQWIYLGTVLLREYREDGRYDEWRNIFDCLRPYQEKTLYGKEILDVEEIKFAFSRFQLGKVRRLCGRCCLPKEAYALRLQVIGLEAECGNTEEALEKARELKRDLTEKGISENGDGQIFIKSLQGVLFHMEALLLQGIAFKSRDYENFQEQINEILNQAECRKRYFDWDELSACVESALLKWHVKEYEESNPFELGIETFTICGSGNVCEESYYLYRAVDAMAVPLMCDCVNLLGWLECAWFEALQGLTPQLALFMMLRGSRREAIQRCYNRRRMMWLPQETVTFQICFLKDVLLENREEMAELTGPFGGGVCRELRENLPEIMVRCMSRCPEELQCEILNMTKAAMETPGLVLGQSMGRFIRGIMAQVSEKNKVKMLGELLETAIVEHEDRHEGTADLFDFYFDKEHLEQYRGLCRIKKETIESLLSDNGDSLYEWRTKITRLLVIKNAGYLTEDQELALTDKIWSRLNGKNLPDLPNHYLWNFLELNYGQSAVPVASIKNCFLSNGMMQCFGKEEGCEMTLGVIRYLDELLTASRQLEKDFWTAEEVEQIYQDALDYWQILKERIALGAEDSHAGRECRERAWKMFHTMAEVYKSISGELAGNMREQISRALGEARKLGIDSCDLKVLFLTEEQRQDFAEEVIEHFYLDETHVVTDALYGACTFMGKYPAESVSRHILNEMLSMVRSGKEPGLVLAIILLHNLLYKKNSLFTEDKIKEADRILIILEKKTKYEKNMESEKQIKNAALIRRVCADLAFEISLRQNGEEYPGVSHWKRVCKEEKEFADVKNEMLV